MVTVTSYYNNCPVIRGRLLVVDNDIAAGRPILPPPHLKLYSSAPLVTLTLPLTNMQSIVMIDNFNCQTLKPTET